ncbi:MAG: carbamoyltransferase HypF [Anaerolineae bacterium]|nr:carbamoyltransferase HypF [Anaerolineae bacterium]
MDGAKKSGLRIHVTGIVQGVGFRPYVFNLAEKASLTGWVQNTSSGVYIQAFGLEEALQGFSEALRDNPPPLARIDQFISETIPFEPFTGFSIAHSEGQPGDFIPVSPDMTLCDDCRRELFEPSNRRYRYPFINCTNCGPRFTIIRDIPYDRPNTTMVDFPLCPSCSAEYHDPRDRRFHAQPVACETCGPHLSLIVAGENTHTGEAALTNARRLIKAGKIVAIKGLGGFHLACDAANAEAVKELRSRKKRSDKPFALMAFDLDAIRRHCIVSPAEAEALLSRERPVVLLEKLPDSPLASQAIAPGVSTLGIMLAYTPLHLLLLEPEEGYPDLLVMTSGNLSDEPIAYQDEDAASRLNQIADAYLTHNRPIHMRIDDSVVTTFRNKPYFFRRARGYAPDPLRLKWELPEILAAGAELKNTFCLTRDHYAFLSHHIGDMENVETYTSFEEGVQHYQNLFRVSPALIACDLHPNYLATRYAEARAKDEGLPIVHVQHHHAHIVACLGEQDWDPQQPVIGLSFDGTGYGTDGAIWGGEALICDYAKFERAFHLAYVPQPGGDAATRKPARMALAHLWAAGLSWDAEIPSVQALCEEERTVLHSQLTRRINVPSTSSMGRLLDAAASMIGVRHSVTYEGQAAIEMEAIADKSEPAYYPLTISNGEIQLTDFWSSLLADWSNGAPKPILAARIHNSVAQVCLQICVNLRQTRDINTVALSGGVWQNLYLLEAATRLLEQANFQVLHHHNIPTNDGGIALGQALVAAALNGKIGG